MPNAPTQTMDEVVAHPQTKALGILQQTDDKAFTLIGMPIQFDGTRPPQNTTPSAQPERYARRLRLLESMDASFAAAGGAQVVADQHKLLHRAADMIQSPKMEAFDLDREPAELRTAYGEGEFAAGCMMARRLVERGVTFVEVSSRGWDTHQDNFTRLKTNLLPKLDVGLAALFNGLEEKGLLGKTAVFVTGEFGRTPKINTRSAEGGRDHYPRCMFMLMAGGKVRGGQVLGESDETASAPKNEGYSPDDVAASFYHNLGIDHTHEYHSDTGRPIMIVRDGTVIPQLFS